MDEDRRRIGGVYITYHFIRVFVFWKAANSFPSNRSCSTIPLEVILGKKGSWVKRNQIKKRLEGEEEQVGQLE